MTNLADLLPAGGGQNNTEFVADGNISAGAPVILTSDGKAAAIGESALAINVGTKVQFDTGSPAFFQHIAAGAGSTVLIGYREQASHGEAVVGTISGTSVSYGTPATFTSNAVYYVSVAYSAPLDKFLITYYDYDNSGYGTAVVATVSGTSVTFGTPVVYESSTASYNESVYDTSAGAFVSVFATGGTPTTKVIACTVSGTTPTFGTAVTADSTGGTMYDQTITYDSSVSRSVIAWRQATAALGRAAVVSVSGTTVTVNSYVQFLANQPTSCALAYDAKADRVVLAYQDVGNSYYGYAVCAEVSSTSLTFGTAVQIQAAATEYLTTTYDETQERVMIGYRDGGNSDQPTVIPTTVTGSTISFGSETLLAAFQASHLCAAYNSTEGKILYAFIESGVSSAGGSVVVTSPGTSSNLTSTNLLGLAPEAISDTATGTINTWGSRCENNDFFGTVSATYGSPTAASAYQSESKVLAYDSANNRFVMAYKDGSNSDYGTAVVGELSGTSITWGTPVVFESATTGSAGMDIAFDSNVNRIVIAYQDQGNSSYGTAIVGSVSGTGSGSTIAFGSPTIFESASTQYLSMTFDSNDNRIVIVYADAGNSYYATYVIGTVTTGPDAISFNTPALLNGSSGTYEIDASFDATENKVLVAYTDTSYDLYVLNLAISSGSGTPGTASSFGIGSPQQRYPRCVYDSVNGKSGVAYAEGTNLPIYFSVISMSGSNVTIETRVLAGDTSDSNYFMHNIAFDASIGQLAICTRDASASKGIAYYGSISGTTSSWTTSGSLFADETILTYGVDVAYDTSANKLAFVYSPSSGSDSAAVVGTLATTTLTIGTDYYVQEDGTLSTTSTSPAQLIGKAIKTNQINIKDYTG